jgi:MFS family permease
MTGICGGPAACVTKSGFVVLQTGGFQESRLMSVAASEEVVKARVVSPRYKWTVLANTTVGTLLATIDSSIMLIALPAIFHAIRLNPLESRNSVYLLWMILGYPMVSSVLVVSFGRLGDIFGRVKMYNYGYIIYTLFSLVLTVEPLSGPAAAMWLIVGRVFQAVGAAFLTGNSAAILTDAFPQNQRGLALGIGNIAGISGSFIGLVVGGVLAAIDWRLIFLVSVPLGLAGTIWSYLGLKELSGRHEAKIDWAGNAAFAGGMMC